MFKQSLDYIRNAVRIQVPDGKGRVVASTNLNFLPEHKMFYKVECL